MKRTVSFLLALVMTVSCFVVGISATSFPFTDVKESDWYYTVVKEAYELGLINGKGSADTYKPHQDR